MVSPCTQCQRVYNPSGLDESGVCALCRQDERLREHAPALLLALRTLVTADNCGYMRETMRYLGMFDAGREAIELATGEVLTPGAYLPNSITEFGPLDLPTAAQALLERLDHMTTEAFSRGDERTEREALRAALAQDKMTG